MLEFAMYHTPMIVAVNAQHQDIAHIANDSIYIDFSYSIHYKYYRVKFLVLNIKKYYEFSHL